MNAPPMSEASAEAAASHLYLAHSMGAKKRTSVSVEDALVSHLASGRTAASMDGRDFRAILDALPTAIYTTDAAGRITHFNPACVEFSGRTPVLGTDSWCVTWKLYNADGTPLPHDECPMAISLKEGRPVRNAQAIAERPDGSRIWFEPYPTPLKDSSGQVVGAINMLVDITARKLAEQQEHRRTQQLAAFMETAAIGLHRVGPDGTILWANPADARLLGYDLEEYIGRNIAEFHVDQELISRILASLKRGERIVEHEVRLVCRDGSIKSALVDSSALFEDGQFVHSQCFTTDITERKRTQAILHQQAQELLDLHRRKDEFIAMLSHELRNPLAPIANAVHLLRLDRDLRSAISQQARSIIERQVSQLSRLVDDLLEVSRITSGKIQLRPEPVAVQAIIERAVDGCRPLIELRQHAIRTTTPSESLWVLADPVRLEQVLVNLLNNAAKYTDVGGQISVVAEAEGDSLVMRVRDNGIGIAPDLLPMVFELFTQADRSLDRAQGGLGIGLALVKRLVELHGGTVRATSAVGIGTEVVVRLPLAMPPARRPTVVRGHASGKQHRVLVVDDNRDSAHSLGMLLEVLGHEVLVVNDGPTALACAADFHPTIAVLDIGMPMMTGYEVAKRLRASPSFAGTTLVAFSGYGQSADQTIARDAGFDHHLVKPASVEQLESILAKAAKNAS